MRAKTVRVDRWEKTPARTAQDKIKRRTPAGSSLAGVLLFCTNLTQPTGNLDTQTSHDVMGLLKTVARKYQQTTILITHDMDVAQLSDRIVYMEDGKIRKERKLYA